MALHNEFWSQKAKCVQDQGKYVTILPKNQCYTLYKSDLKVHGN